jgi:hypothetical protein
MALFFLIVTNHQKKRDSTAHRRLFCVDSLFMHLAEYLRRELASVARTDW